MNEQETNDKWNIHKTIQEAMEKAHNEPAPKTIKFMEENTNHTATIMKELSDIKASLAVNTNETANIKGSVGEIKSDIKDIKNDSVNRREFSENVNSLSSLTKDVRYLQKVTWIGLGIISAAEFYFNYIKK